MKDGNHLAHIRKYEFDKLEVIDCFTEHLSVGVGGEELVDSVKDGPGKHCIVLIQSNDFIRVTVCCRPQCSRQS